MQHYCDQCDEFKAEDIPLTVYEYPEDADMIVWEDCTFCCPVCHPEMFEK